MLVLDMHCRYSKKIFRSFPRLSVLRYKDKIEFKIFFAFVALYSIAWFNRLGSSNFYFIYLFFVLLNPPYEIRTKDIVLNVLKNVKVLLTPSKNATVKVTSWTKSKKRYAFQVLALKSSANLVHFFREPGSTGPF